MNYEQIIFETKGQIATITLNRPEKLNAFTGKMLQEFRQALQQVEDDDNLRVSIITGAGRAFCAGSDMSAGGSAFDNSQRRPESQESGAQPSQSQQGGATSGPGIMDFFLGLTKPSIVAINGPCVGVGISMVLPLDIRIAAESGRISFAFNKRGVLPELASPWFLPRIIGISKAAEIMYTGRMLSAKESLEIGLVSRVVPDNQLMATANELAQEIIVNCAPVSVALTKYMLYQFLSETNVEKANAINSRYFGWSGRQPDAREGVVSFLEKRPAKWKMSVPKDLPDFFPLKT